MKIRLPKPIYHAFPLICVFIGFLAILAPQPTWHNHINRVVYLFIPDYVAQGINRVIIVPLSQRQKNITDEP